MKGLKREQGLRDLTKGSIAPSLIAFALPFLGASMVQQLYSTVDVMFVASYLGTGAAAAVGSSGLLVICMVGFFTGLSVGISILTAQAFARRDTGRLRRIIHGSAALTIGLALLFTVVGIWLAPTCLVILHTPEAIMADAVWYIRLYMLSFFSLVSYNIGAGIVRALGDSRSPLWYQALGGLMNVAGNFIFIAVLHWGLTGAALTTVCSQTVAAVLMIRRLRRLPEAYRLQWRGITWEKEISQRVLQLGLPAAVQAIVITLSNLIVQGTINGLGITSIAAFTAYFKVENLIYLPIMAVGQACSIFVSQNMGKRDFSRIRQGVRVSVQVGALVTLVMSGLVLGLAPYVFSLFASEASVISLGCQIAFVAYPFYFLYVFLESFGAALRGAGNTLAVMSIVVVNMCLVRIAILHVLMTFYPQAVGVAAVYPLTWGCTALSLGLYYKWWLWQQGAAVVSEEVAA